MLQTQGWNILSFRLDLKSGNDSISFSEFSRKLFHMEGPVNEILNLLLLSTVLEILSLNYEKIVGHLWQILSKLPESLISNLVHENYDAKNVQLINV